MRKLTLDEKITFKGLLRAKGLPLEIDMPSLKTADVLCLMPMLYGPRAWYNWHLIRKAKIMTEQEEHESKIRRAGYQAGFMQGKRERTAEQNKREAELVHALGEALKGIADTDTEAHVVYEKYAADHKPKQTRQRKICKGSMVKWDADNGLLGGGTLVKFVDYVHGQGELWKVEHPTTREIVEHLITVGMITRFGKLKRPKPEKRRKYPDV